MLVIVMLLLLLCLFVLYKTVSTRAVLFFWNGLAIIITCTNLIKSVYECGCRAEVKAYQFAAAAVQVSEQAFIHSS